MEFMFIIFIYLWLRFHTITNKESHTVMPHRFSHFFSLMVLWRHHRDVPANVKSFFKHKNFPFPTSPKSSQKNNFSLLFLTFTFARERYLLLFMLFFKGDTLCLVSSILRLMNPSICQLILYIFSLFKTKTIVDKYCVISEIALEIRKKVILGGLTYSSVDKIINFS